ncbi:hypothetical protein ON010_g1283 [Phytophthora cinnamomi]|nr:hypothetical protein ON010_g1283 [Phytophthora cinnamomi]
MVVRSNGEDSDEAMARAASADDDDGGANCAMLVAFRWSKGAKRSLRGLKLGAGTKTALLLVQNVELQSWEVVNTALRRQAGQSRTTRQLLRRV